MRFGSALEGRATMTPWEIFVVRLDEGDRAMEKLSAAGIGVGIHHPTAAHLTEAYAGFPHLDDTQQREVAVQLANAVGRRSGTQR